MLKNHAWFTYDTHELYVCLITTYVKYMWHILLCIQRGFHTSYSSLAKMLLRRIFMKNNHKLKFKKNYFPLKEGVTLVTNLNSLLSLILFAKFGWNWPSGSGEEVENVKKFTVGRMNRQTDGQIDIRTPDKL